MHILYLSFPGGGLDTSVRVLAPAMVQAGHRVSILYIYPPSRNPGLTPSNGASGCRVYHAVSGPWHYYLSLATHGLTRLPRVVRAFEEAQALRKTIEEIASQAPLDLVELDR